ncbi:MAG: PKD domain-containing protein [Halobacteriales archaeon]|nr:PKD domain-containing protein [Halobacteriales archaeon]
MTRILAAIASLGLLLGAVPLAMSATSAAEPVGFGMDSASMASQANAGVKADYGTFWIGPWTLTSGWGGPDAQLAAMKAAGVTPAIHFYYWGDDISQSCLENGCWSTLHNAQKDKAGWQKLAEQLVDHLNAKMGGKPVVVFLESEFNKGNVGTYEPLDGYLAEKADFLHAGYPSVQVVMALGNWAPQYWGTWDRTAAASDMTGIQGLRGSTHQNLAEYGTLYEGLKAGADKLQSLFHKPIMLTDIALSSYPEPGWLQPQADTLAELFAHLDDLKATGVKAIIYRSWMDSPGMSTANYYGMAERYWGLANKTAQKPSALVWVNGVRAERNQPPVASFTATATGLTVRVDASGSSDPDGNALTYSWAFGDGATATGPQASHTYAAGGAYTVALTASDGRSTASAAKGVTVTPPTFSATFKLGNVNEWWVDTKVASDHAISGVSATVNGGAPHALAKTNWGSWAASFSVPKGSTVVFTAKDAAGASATSQAFTWLAPSSTTTPSFKATFTPKTLTNHWWVETSVSTSAPIAKVEVRLNGGAWTVLPKTDWGTYAKSLSVPAGTQIVFRATSSSGATALSAAYTEK